jgi:hypothetical protein
MKGIKMDEKAKRDFVEAIVRVLTIMVALIVAFGIGFIQPNITGQVRNMEARIEVQENKIDGVKEAVALLREEQREMRNVVATLEKEFSSMSGMVKGAMVIFSILQTLGLVVQFRKPRS